MRPVRKRPAPEDFLGKGSNKKILMGKYVGFRFLYRVSGFGLVSWFGGFVFGVFPPTVFSVQQFSNILTLKLPKGI